MSSRAPTPAPTHWSSPGISRSESAAEVTAGATPLHIHHSIAPGSFGGAESVVLALSAAQRLRGHSVSVSVVLDPTPGTHPFMNALLGSGVSVYPVIVPVRGYFAQRAAVRRLLRAIGPDVVHTHGYRSDLLDAPVARSLGLPTVTTVHGFTGGDAKNRLYQWVQRRAFRRFDAVVAVSLPLATELAARGTPRERLHIVPNAWGGPPPLDRRMARRALGLEDGTFHVGWVGRLSPEKGADVLLDALPHLAEIPLIVSFVGTGPDESALRQRARRLGVEERVRWHGAVPEAGRLLSALDLFVLSSRTEGTPMVLFEAMAAGVPIVATRVGGVPYVLSRQEALLVCPNDPALLARAVRAAWSDPATAAQRSAAAGRQLLRRFALDAWLAAYDEIYRRQLAPGQPGGRS